MRMRRVPQPPESGDVGRVGAAFLQLALQRQQRVAALFRRLLTESEIHSGHAGCGRVQREGGPIEEIRPGDVVWFPPSEKHWHGASPSTSMTHIAIQEELDGTTAEWFEKVSDEQYGS